jgi:hypothetical protein
MPTLLLSVLLFSNRFWNPLLICQDWVVCFFCTGFLLVAKTRRIQSQKKEIKMKNYIYILAIVLQSNIVTFGQTPFWDWAKRAGGTRDDEGVSMSIDASGNVYVTGIFQSATITFGNTTFKNPDTLGRSDIFVVKYDSTGKVIWAKSAGGKEDEWSRGISTDVNGNVYVTGSFSSPTITFGNVTLTNINGARDIFIVKYDASGNVLWATSSGGVGYDDSFGITVDANGNVLVTGYFWSSVISFGSHILVNTDSTQITSDIFVAKYDASGNVLWAKSASGDNNDRSQGVSTDASGNVVITGNFESSTITFGTTTLTNSTAGAVDNIFIAKYDGSGNMLWAKSAGGTGSDYGNSVSTDANGNAYITGSFNSPTVIFGSTTLTNTGNFTVFIAKYNVSGNVIWAKSEGVLPGFYVWSNSINCDATGNVFVTGRFDCYSLVIGNINLPNASSGGPTDIFVAKYDGSGNVLWAKSAGGTGDDSGSCIKADTNGKTYVAGRFGNPSITFGMTKLTSATTDYNSDVFLAKLSPCNFSDPTIAASRATTFCQGDSVTLTASSADFYLWSNDATTQSITVSNAGNYSVAVTDARGCTANSSATIVTINPLPINTITPGDATTFCQGDSITLTASMADFYLWSNNATTQSITVSNSGNYSVTVTDASGCSATSSAVTVTVNSLPTATITPDGATTFCQEDFVTLTASSADSYLWSNDATTQSITISNAGNYSVTVTDASGCSKTSSATTVTVNLLPIVTITPGSATTFCEGNSVVLTASSGASYLWSNNATTQSITVLRSGNYSVMVTDASGCSATSSATIVTVNTLPIAAITPDGATTFCEGNSVTLTASSEASYLWSNNATTQAITVSSSGNYSVTITNANGCSMASSETTVTVNALPIATITVSGATLTSSSTTGNQWYLNGDAISNATSQDNVVTENGSYTVTITDANGCSATSAPFNYVSVGVAEIENQNSVMIFPNPNNGMVTIQGTEGNGDVTMINAFGEIVFIENTVSDKTEIDLRALSKGIYFVQIRAGEKVYNRRITIR